MVKCYVWKGSQVRSGNRGCGCEREEQDKWYLEADFGLRKGVYFLFFKLRETRAH